MAVSKSARHGFTLIEVMVSGILLGTVLLMAMPTLYIVRQQQRATNWDQRAIIEADNVMDRFTASGFSEVTQESATEFVSKYAIKDRLSESRLELAVQAIDSQLDAKQVIVKVFRERASATLTPPVRLTAWVYRDGSQP